MVLSDRSLPSAPIRALIVDDTPFMRKTVERVLGGSDMIEVVGTASNGLECLDKIDEHRPDVITLDIDMPVMNGISAVKNIMIRHQLPIVIISSLVQDGYFAFEALRLGVMDFVPKPSKVGPVNFANDEELIRQRVLIAASMQVNRVRRVRYRRRSGPGALSSLNRPSGITVIGTTLAGPNNIMHLVSALPSNFSGAIIAIQEIHPRILVPFCACFNQISPVEVVPVVSETPLLPGRVYIGSTFSSLTVEKSDSGPSGLEVRANQNGQLPIDGLFASAARHFGERTCGVLLTGVGADGAKGMERIKAGGGVTIAQEISSCPFPNLVENAIDSHIVDAVLSIGQIAHRLSAWPYNDVAEEQWDIASVVEDESELFS
jgi:two-component system chemotaxis response regulator CheB